MKEKEQFDAVFQEIAGGKGGIKDKTTKALRRGTLSFRGRYVSTGILLGGLGSASFYFGYSTDPLLYVPGIVLNGAGFFLSGEPISHKLIEKVAGIKPSKEAYPIAESKISKLYGSEQKDSLPKGQIESFLKKIFYLPPVGGKVTLERGSLRPTPLFPALTADEKVEEIIRFRQNRELDDAYVHQLTVQGALPDEFKYTALALITNSTYRNDWRKPFYEAPWGKVAPLVHGGGGENPINPFWSIRGRTDFIQRVAEVHEPELETMEQYGSTPELTAQFSAKALDNAVLEQEERRRLILDINFYQRSAFALHAKTGTVPDIVPPDVAKVGRETWGDFVKDMRNILSSYGGGDIVKPRWFTRIPRLLPSWGLVRYETNYKPVQEALISLEEIKSKNPSLRREVNLLMNKTVSAIDNAIGI